MSSYKPYPYPVIGNDEEISGSFSPEMSYSIDPINTTLNIKFELTNEYYKQLIEDGSASFVVDITCSRTYFRKTYTTNEYSLDIKESSSIMRGKVDVVFYICTNEALNNYDPLNQGPSYVESSDIIGEGGDTIFIAEKEYDPLKAPIKSIIKIKCTDKKQDNFDISYDNDEFITICIPKEMHRLYSDIRRSASDVLHSCLVLPALMDAIETARSDEHANSSWAHKLNEIYINRNINPEDDPLIIAQKILNNPVLRSMDWCDKATDEEE